MTTAIVNWVPTRDGKKARAVCQWCDRTSRPVETCEDGQPKLWELGAGWSRAGYPVDFTHTDGSVGGQFTCPACARLRDRRQAASATPLLSPSPRRATAIAAARHNSGRNAL